MPPIILASSSVYRRQLLDKLQLPYQSMSPDVDETPLPNESARELALRLAVLKAVAVAEQTDQGIIIGSDQTAELGTEILGKPGSHSKAFSQLQACSGKSVNFWTGLAVYNCESKKLQKTAVPFRVHFRHLTDQMIESYLNKEQPFDCAGSFKCEGLGIALFERLEGDDPNSLIGLPLIELCNMLNHEGIRVI